MRTTGTMMEKATAVRLSDLLVQEFDLENKYTRKTLERVPIDKFDWKPHEKSMTLGWLSTFPISLSV